MFLLIHLLPSWIFNIFFVVGAIGLVVCFFMQFIPARFVPFITTYRIPILWASVLSIIIGIWFNGAISNDNKWQQKVVELEKKVAEAEVKSSEANTALVEKTNKKFIEQNNNNNLNMQYIDREVIRYNNTCVIPKEVVSAVNAAAQNKEIK